MSDAGRCGTCGMLFSEKAHRCGRCGHSTHDHTGNGWTIRCACGCEATASAYFYEVPVPLPSKGVKP